MALAQAQGPCLELDRPVLRSERGGGLSAESVQGWFQRVYETVELAGCSSHSGRRTFITWAARNVSAVGGSLRDVQQFAGRGHASGFLPLPGVCPRASASHPPRWTQGGS